MSGRAWLAACAAVATLAAASALLPLVNTASWLAQAALLLSVQAALGTVGRRIPLPRPVTVMTQALASLFLLTAIFVSERMFLAVVPTPGALHEWGRLLARGAEDVAHFATPAPLSDGIRLLLIGGVLAVGLLVDALAVTYRSAAPAGLPLLALYSVAAGLSQGSTPWLWFLCAAAGYLLLLLAEGRVRLSQWGRVFGTPGGPGGGGRTAEPVAGRVLALGRSGRRIGAVTLAIAVLLPTALPSLGEGLLDRAPRPGGQRGGDGPISAVNPLVALQDSLNQPENRTALTYTTNAANSTGLYLRIVALDQFDGAAWKPSERGVDDVPDPLPEVPGLSSAVDSQRVTTRVTAADWYAQNWLPMPYPASRVRLEGRWRFEPEGRTVVGDRGQNTRGVRYEVESLSVRPTVDQLVNAPPPAEALREEYTRVPDSLPPVVWEQAREVTRGSHSDYQRAVRLQDWFTHHGGFTYDTEVQAGSGSAAIVNFLRDREGFCIHFAFSMAAMSRTLGIPARVAVGFTPGTPQSDGRTAVGLQDAHAWPELYFEGVGWTRFEPTPSRGSTPAYTVPDAPDSDPDDASELPRPGSSELPSDASSPSPECAADAEGRPDCAEQAMPVPDSGSGDTGLPWGLALGLTAAALVGLAVPLLPLLWRLRVRSRRLGRATAGGQPPGREAADADGSGPEPWSGAVPGADPQARTLAAWRELTDSGWDYGIVPDDSATPRKAVARLVRLGDLDAEAASSAHRVAHAVEQVLYAPSPRPTPGLASEVRRVQAGLRASADRRKRLRALLLPRSTVRVLWSASQRRATLADRWRAAGRRWWAALRPARQRG